MSAPADSVGREAAATARGTTPIELIAGTLRGDTSCVATQVLDAQEFARVARDHGVHLLLWHVLHAHAPEDVIAPLATDLAAEVGRSALRRRELARVLDSLSSSGVEAIVFKGAALAHTCYGEPWMRPRLDTDVLVTEEEFERAAGALIKAGYRRWPALSTGAFVSHQAVFTCIDALGVEHLIDLHRRVLNPEMLAGLAEYRDLKRDARAVLLDGATVQVPSPVWSTVLACAHRLVHHQQRERLIWLYDIHLLAERLEAVEWEQLTGIARDRRISALCADGLAAASQTFGTAVPAAVLRVMAEAGRSDPSRSYVERGVGHLDVLRDDLRRLPRWRDRLRLLREHAFPSPAFMRSRYQAQNPLLLPVLYTRRLVSGAFRWMRT